MGGGTSPWWEMVIVGIVVAGALIVAARSVARSVRLRTGCSCSASATCMRIDHQAAQPLARSPSGKSGGRFNASQ